MLAANIFEPNNIIPFDAYKDVANQVFFSLNLFAAFNHFVWCQGNLFLDKLSCIGEAQTRSFRLFLACQGNVFFVKLLPSLINSLCVQVSWVSTG